MFLTLLILSHPLDEIPLPAICRQVVYVESDSWEETKAVLGRYERSLEGWKQVGETWQVRLGGKGLGWGDGVFHFPIENGPVKREGDKRSPAGVFDLPLAFGKESFVETGLTYRKADDRDFWIDDVGSPDYNTWQRIETLEVDPKLRWKSWETMTTKGPYYDLGIVVGHNTKPITPGHGSAIFLHLWANPDETTSGCTAMSRPNMETLLKWLNKDQHPLLVQLPKNWDK